MSQQFGLIDDLIAFFRDYYRDEIGTLARRFPEDQRSLHVEWMDLYRFDNQLAEDYLEGPGEHHDHLEEALAQFDLPVDVDLSSAHVRVHLPTDEDRTIGVADLRSRHHGQYIGVRGQVRKTTQVAPEPSELAFECQRCGTLTHVPQLDDGSITDPHECPGCDRQGPFRINYDESHFRDHQLIRLQERPEEAAGSGRDIDVVVRHDLVDEVEPGDRVTISGVYRLRESAGDSATFATFLDGRAIDHEAATFSAIDVTEHRERIEALAAGEEGDPYELLRESIAPAITDEPEIKLAVILQLFGGIRIVHGDGTADRGDFHVLLYGDPGTGKSSVLEAIEEIAPTSASASGKDATTAGMTAAAVRDDFGDTEWTLEAGALVLADGGVACIDEIDKVDGDVRSSLHDALAKQKVKTAKAGITATLPTRCAVLAAGNPAHGRWDDHLETTEQIDLGPTLLSRFDLKFKLTDEPDEQKDREIASHILRHRRAGVENAAAGGQPTTESDTDPTIDADVIRAWVALAKRECYPQTPPELDEEIEESYVTLRNARSEDGPIPVNARVVHSIRRIAEASARVRLSDTVEQEDIDRARSLVGESLQQFGIDPETGELDVDVVETGSSKNQRERIMSLKDVIGKVAREYDGGAPVEEVLDAAEDAGFSRSKAEHAIQKLKNSGDVYEPTSGGIEVI